MKITTLMLFVSMMSVSAAGLAQKITFSVKGERLEKVLTQIRKQSGYDIVYNASEIRKAKPVTLNLQGVSLEKALEESLKNQNLEYSFSDQIVMIKAKEPSFLDKLVDVFTRSINVSGVVLDEKGMPLPGATIRVRGIKQTVVTDKEGRFYLPGVDDKAVLVVSYVGYIDQEIAAKEGVLVNMELKSDELKEVVVAYGKTTQQALTGSVTVVKGEQIENLPNRSFDRSLQGMVPGLLVTSGNGQPGGGLSNFVLRGISTAADPYYNGSVSRTPLIVVDGVPISQDPAQLVVQNGTTPINNPVAHINPSDIESISVLKDASAVALYGSKASNGVILITTKKGKAGNTVFSFRSQADIAQQLTNKQEVLNQQEYLAMLYDTYKNTPRMVNNVSTPWTDADILTDLKGMFPTRADGSFYPQPDWAGLIYKDNALTATNEISASGGTEKSSFYLNLENLNQDGIVRNTGYDRTSARLNFENRPATWFKYGLNTNLSYNKQNYSSIGEGINGISFSNTMSPLNPARLENGSLIENYKWGTPVPSALLRSPVASSEYNTNQNVSYRGLNKLYGEINFLKYLSLSSSLGIDYMQTEVKEKVDPRLVSDDGATIGDGGIAERAIRRSNLISTNILKAADFLNGPHSLDALFGYEFQIQNQKTLGLSVTGLSQPYFEEITNPTPSRIKSFEGVRYKETLLSYFGQVNYNFLEKYYLSGSIRSDGSSKFGDRKRFGTYWSVGAGWVLSEENFLKTANSALNFLKLRGSFGAAGNSSAINAATQFDIVDIWRYYNEAAAVPSTRPGNPDIRWERTFSADLGLDAALFDNRLKLNFDIYKRDTRDLIYQVDLVPSTGYYSVLSNIGKMQNKGIEVFAAGDLIRNKAFNWNIAATWSTNQNKLVKADVPAASLKTSYIANQEGKNFNSYYLVRWAGVNQDNGKPQWLDAAGNATDSYSDENRVFAGKPQPDGFGTLTNSLRFGSFEFSAMLYYQYGYQIFNQTMQSLLNDGATPHMNQLTEALDYWTAPGDAAKNPRRLLNNSDRGNRESTRYLFDGDYLRLKNVTLQYQLPANFVNRIHLKSARVFVQGNNLALWTKYPGQDPDDINAVGTVNFAYPNQRSYSLGINVNF